MRIWDQYTKKNCLKWFYSYGSTSKSLFKFNKNNTGTIVKPVQSQFWCVYIGECAKLRASRAFVSYVPHVPTRFTSSRVFIFLRALRASIFLCTLLTCLHIFTCLTCLHFFYVPDVPDMPSFFYVPDVPSFFLHALHAFIFFFRCLYFLTCLHFLRVIFYVP